MGRWWVSDADDPSGGRYAGRHGRTPGYRTLIVPFRRQAALRKWRRLVAQRAADKALRRAAAALASRLSRARALRTWSALHIAHQQSEIEKLHEVAQWHLKTLLGAGSGSPGRHAVDPVQQTRELISKWSSALLVSAFNSWRAWTVEQRESKKPGMEHAIKRWANAELGKAWSEWADLVVTRAAARRVGVKWRNRHVAAAWRTWKEQAIYRRAAQALFADMRMLPGAEMLKRWRHHRMVSARMAEAFQQATALFARSHLRVAMRCFKRVYASENATGALTSVASSFMRGDRKSRAFNIWSKLAREGANAAAVLGAAVGRWHKQSVAFAFDRLAGLAANGRLLARAMGAIRNVRA